MFSKLKGFFYKHYLMYKKSSAERSTIFIYPFVALFSVGILALYLRATGGPADAVPFVIVGTIAWTFYDLCQRIPVYGILLDIWDHCLKHSILSPATIAEYIIGNSLFGLSVGIFSTLLLAVLGFIFFGFNIFSAGIVLLPALAILFVFASSVGLGINSMIIAYDKEYMALVWSVPGLIMVFSGVYYPVSALPGIVQNIAYVLPTTYAIDAMRISLGLSEGAVLRALAIASVLCIAYYALFYRMFERALDKSRRTGRTITD